ncbi:MAG: hypothetical protein AB7O68_10825 [Pirellulales bacterium]
MTVPAATVKSLCTSAEVDLVRASRQPQLGQLSAAQLKSLAARARKLQDKWRDAKRDQARSKSRAAGVGKPGDNTRVKSQIFREARESFEARLKQLESASAGAKSSTKSKAKSAAKSKGKKQRTVDHRNRRAAVREGLAVVKDIVNEEPPTSATPAESTAAENQPTKPAARPRRQAKPVAPKKPVSKLADRTAAQQLRAETAAKQARLKQSGKTTRVLGHVSARGQRKQARRDSMN